MSKEKSDHLVEKYLAGDSTLAEEEELFNAENKPSGIKEWSIYIGQKKKKAPAHLNSKIWAAIQKKKRRKQRFLVSISGVAASIALVIAFFVGNAPKNNSMSREEKEALLMEALSMFPDEQKTTSKENIIYEDDIVVIYEVTE